ncbi:hypothetical protein THAOC_27448, partial [Thalassiosira oceanica]
RSGAGTLRLLELKLAPQISPRPAITQEASSRARRDGADGAAARRKRQRATTVPSPRRYKTAMTQSGGRGGRGGRGGGGRGPAHGRPSGGRSGGGRGGGGGGGGREARKGERPVRDGSIGSLLTDDVCSSPPTRVFAYAAGRRAKQDKKGVSKDALRFRIPRS